nr:hypothetical protein [Tanacetum cinerariifolium]
MYQLLSYYEVTPPYSIPLQHAFLGVLQEQYITHADYALWEVIVNGDAPAAIALVSCGVEATVPPKTTAEKIERRNELKTRFGGNKESKKMQKTILKQQYKNFVASRSEGLDKTYDRCQKFISQLEIHGEVISQEYVNLKLLRSLPPAWNTHTLIMRNKSDLDTLSMDDLYNNFKVYEAEIKGQSSSSLSYQNVALVYSDNTSTTNKANNTAHDVSAASLQGQTFSSTYADDVIDVFESASDSSVNESEEYNNQANDRYKAGEGYHAVPPSYTGNFMPPKPNMSFAGLVDSVFKSPISEPITSVHETKTSTSKTSKESIEKPKTVRPSAPIIKYWESNSDDDCEIIPSIK